MKLLVVVLLATLVALCMSENIISYKTPLPVPEKMQTATTDDAFLYVVTYNDPAKIIKYKLGTMERVDTMLFAIEQNFTFATAASVDTKKKYLYVYGYQSLLSYDPLSEYIGVPAVARVLIQNGEFKLDSVQAVPLLNKYNKIRNVFVNEDYIYYTFNNAVSRAPINDLTSVETYETGLRDYTNPIATDPSDSSQRIVYFTNGTENFPFQLKTFQMLPSIALSGFFDGNYVYSSYSKADSERNSQAYITRTDLSTQERVDIPIGPLQAYLGGVSYVVSFIKDTVTNKLYALYRSKGINYLSPHGFTVLSDATVYIIDDVTLTTTATIALPGTNSYRGETFKIPPPIFTLIANENAYIATFENILCRYSLSSAEQPVKIALPMYGFDTVISMIARQNNLYYYSSVMGIVRYNYATGTTSIISNITADVQWMHVDQKEQYLYVNAYYRTTKYDLATVAAVSSRAIPLGIVYNTHTIDGVEYLLVKTYTDSGQLALGLFDYDNNKFVEVIATLVNGDMRKVAFTVDSSNTIYCASSYNFVTTVSRWTKEGLQDLFTFDASGTNVFNIAIDGDLLYVAQTQKLLRFNLTVCSANTPLGKCEPMNSFNSGVETHLDEYLYNVPPLMFPNGPYMYWSNIVTGELMSVHKETFCVEKIETNSRARGHIAAMRSDGTIFFGGYRAVQYNGISLATAASNFGILEVTNTTSVCIPATPVPETPRTTVATTIPPTEIPRSGANVVQLSCVSALVLGIMLL